MGDPTQLPRAVPGMTFVWTMAYIFCSGNEEVPRPAHPEL